jgi:replicative DNA helicase
MNNEEMLFSTQAEDAILSLILNSPSKSFEVTNLLTEMFSSVQAQTLYNTISGLSRSSIEPSSKLIKAHLKARGEISLVGGDEYIDWLLSKKYNLKDFKEYEKILINSFKARKLIELSTSIPDLVKGSRGDSDKVLSAIKNSLDDLSLTVSRDGATHINSFLPMAYENIKNRINNPGLSGLTTGFEDVDALTGGMSEGELWIVASRPSMGKTSWVINSLARTANGSGHGSLLFSLEMSKQAITDRLIVLSGGMNLTNLRLGTLNEKDIESLDSAFKEIKAYDLYLDTNFYNDPDYLINTIRKFKSQHDIKCVWIDYLQLVVERDNQATHELGRVTRALKRLAKDLNISIGVVSQLNRSLEMRDDKRPILSDLRQSGNIEEDADVVVFLYRDDYYFPDTTNKGIMEFIVKKNRNGPIGKTQLWFEAETTRIFDFYKKKG